MTRKSSLSVNIVITFVAVGFLAASSVYAATPALSLVNVSGDSVQINVNGDPNSGVMFYYNAGNVTLGTTNSSGAFSTTISASSYAINSGSSVYVIVNSQQSSVQTWPSTASSGISGTPSLSQSSITLGLGQSSTVTSQASTNSVYMSASSNPSAATVQTNGAQITVTGSQIGSTTATICYTGTASNCATLYVTVQSASVQTLSFSQNNVALTTGQNVSIGISGGSGSYNVASNSNSSAVSTTLNGSTITVYGVATGSANINVCDQSSRCATLYTTTNGNTSSSSLSFNQSNPSISVGQIITVNISGGTGYYVSNNSNPSVASQALNGSAITISGLAGGTTTITACSVANGCGSIYVTVGSSGSNQSVVFGTTNPTVTMGQNMNIGLSGGSSYFISSNANTNIAQASVNGSTLTLYGANIGSDSIAVCASAGGCNTLYVIVTNTGVAAPQTTVTTNSAFLAEIQSLQSAVTQLLTQIQSIQSKLAQLAAEVAGSAQSNTGSASATTASSAASYKFYNFLTVGSQGADVTALQNRLMYEGVYSGSITGYYGSLTEEAVKKYQSAHGITPLGYLGPSTRTALNAGS